MTNLMLSLLALVLGTFACPALSQTQAYPARPVRIIIPFPPGEAADIIARLVTPSMSERMGQHGGIQVPAPPVQGRVPDRG